MRHLLIVTALVFAVCCVGGRCNGNGHVIFPTQLTVQNPAAMVISGDLEVTYQLSCPSPKTSGIGVFFSTDAGATWSSATVKNPSDGDLQGNLIKNLWAPGEGATYTFVWDSVTDVGHDYVQDIQLALYIEELYPSDWSWNIQFAAFHQYRSGWQVTKVFTIDNDRAPAVTVTTPVSPQAGDVLVEFSLSDEDDDLCRVTVEYSKDDGQSYFAATLEDVTSTPISSNILFGLDASATPRRYIFIWDSGTDLIAQHNEQVKLRLVANDGIKDSAASETSAFTVSNNEAPVVTIEDIGGLQVGDVAINFSLADPDSTLVAMIFQYSTDGGATWLPATIRYTSAGTITGAQVQLTGTPSVEADGCCVWASLADGVATGVLETNVRLSAVAQDEQRQGAVDTTRSFVVDNTVAGSWGTLTTLSQASTPASNPTCALGALDNPTVAWECSDGSVTQIYFTSYDGSAWSAPAAATASAAGATRPRIAITSDADVHLVYVDLDEVLYTGYDGTSWSTPVAVSGAGVAGEPDLKADDNDVLHVVWKEMTGGRYLIHYCQVTGGAPGAAELVNDTSESSESPAIACVSTVLDTTPYIVWSESPSGTWEILSARRAGGVWEPLGTVSGTAGASRRPCIAACPDTGEVAAAWMDDTPGTNFDVYISIFSGTWQAATNVSANDGNSVNPSISYRAGSPRLAWSDNTSPAQNYQAAFSSFLAGTGSPPVLISNTSGEATMPVLVSGTTGRDVLVWQEITATGTTILCRMR